MKYRMQIKKGPEVRFVSHLDTMKTLERSMRRGGVPMAFSKGFNPHPKISLGSALAVGVTSDSEYLDVELAEYLEPEQLQMAINNGFPKGFAAVQVKKVPEQGPSLMAIINRADYFVSCKLNTDTDSESIQQKVKSFLELTTIQVIRKTKKGDKEVEIRPGIFKLEGHINGREMLLRMLLQTGSAGNVKPEEVVKEFSQFAHIDVDWMSLKVHRVGLLVEEKGKLVSPMEC